MFALLVVLRAVAHLDAAELDVARVVLATAVLHKRNAAATSLVIARVAAVVQRLKLLRTEASRWNKRTAAAAAVQANRAVW